MVKDKKVFAIIAVLLISIGFVLALFSFSNLPSNKFWDQDIDVTWYRYSGIGITDGKAQFKIAPYIPKKNEPTSDEIEKFAKDIDSKFFDKSPKNTVVNLSSVEGIQLKGVLYNKGYRELGATIAQFKTTPTRRRTATVFEIVSIVLGAILLAFSLKKPGSPQRKEPIGKMAKHGCPHCNAPVSVDDEFCPLCGKKLENK